MFTARYFSSTYFAPYYFAEAGYGPVLFSTGINIAWAVAATDERIASALAGTYGPVSINYRYLMVKHDGSVLADVTAAVISCRITGNNDRDIFRTAQFEFHASTATELGIDVLTSHIAPFADVLVDMSAIASLPLGVFHLDFPDRVFTPNFDSWFVEGNDLCIHLMQDFTENTYTVAGGENYISGTSAVLDILANYGILEALPSTDLVLPADRSWPPGTPYLKIVNELLMACNMYHLWMDNNGVAQTRTRTNLASRTSDVDYTGDDFVLIPINESADTTRFANRIVAVVEDPNVGILRSVAVNDDPASPTSTVTLGVTRTKVLRPQVADQTTLDEYAATELQQAASLYKRVKISTQPDPRRGAHEICTLTAGDEYTGEKWWIRNWELSLETGGVMIHNIAKVDPVNAS